MTGRGRRSARAIAYNWLRALETIASVSKTHLDMQECSKSGREPEIGNYVDNCRQAQHV